MLERLSSILRFMVYDCSENRVGLSKEITAVEDLLEIHKMKNSEQRNIELQVSGVKGFHLIAPLIIVNFVENACKHSDVVNNPEGFLHIHISVDDADHCLLELSNTFRPKAKIDIVRMFRSPVGKFTFLQVKISCGCSDLLFWKEPQKTTELNHKNKMIIQIVTIAQIKPGEGVKNPLKQ